jgi:hypothetical protein
LPLCGIIFSTDELCDVERDLNQLISSAEAHSAYETVKSSFYGHSIGGHDKEYLLNRFVRNLSFGTLQFYLFIF